MDGLLSYEERLWQQLYEGARQALQAGQPNDALKDFEAASNVAEEFGQKDERLVKALTGVGMCFIMLKEFENAEKPLERALKLAVKHRGATDPMCLGILGYLAAASYSLNKLEMADKYYTQALGIHDQLEMDNAATKVLRQQKAMVQAKIRRAKAVASDEDLVARAEASVLAEEQAASAAEQALKAAAASDKQVTTSSMPAQEPKPARTAARNDINSADEAPAEKAPVVPPAAAQAGGTAAAAAATPEPAVPAPPPPSTTPASPPLDPDNLAGSVIDNRYEIYGRIGEGGMSAIYRGKHMLMDRPVAVKILHKHLTLSEKVRQRFQQESRTASKLQHPNIVGVHDFGEVHGFFYLVMDYVDGISLADLIRDVDHLPPDRCVNILMQICDGLQHAHDNGILHRDLKPSNIMLVDINNIMDIVKIVDFGIAKVIDTKDENDEHSLQLTQTGETVGSPLYMSPEQCRGEKLDTRSDIYSLGCLAYKALTGVPPFGGNNQIDVYIKHTQVPAPRFNKSCPGLMIPNQLETIVLKMLEKEPHHRFSSMNEVRGALSLLTAAEGW